VSSPPLTPIAPTIRPSRFKGTPIITRRLVDADVHAAAPGAVHPDVRDEVAAVVDDGDVLRLADLLGTLFLLRR
jgi:hypothetical protein